MVLFAHRRQLGPPIFGDLRAELALRTIPTALK